MDQTLDVIERWSEGRINSKKFNKVFQVDGIPIWHLLEPLVKSAHIPRPFRSLPEIERGAKAGTVPSSFKRLQFMILRKGLAINERIKRWISKMRRKDLQRIGKADVLFIAYTNQIFETDGGVEFLGFGDVAKDLKERGAEPLVLICDSFSKNSLFGLRKFDNLLYSHIDLEIIEESEKQSRRLAREWKKLEKERLFMFQGKSYWRFVKNEMNFLFSPEVLSTLIKYYLTFKEIIQKHEVKLVYLTGLIGFYESSLLVATHKFNKKVVYSPHGYGGYTVPLYFEKKLLENVLFIASGGEEKEKLRRLGIKAKKVFLAGSPFFDKIAEYKSEKEKEKTEKTVTLLTTALVEYKFVEKNEYFDYIRKYLKQISKVKKVKRIVIKLHPNEKYKSDYESIVKSLKLTNVEIVQRLEKGFLYSVLRDSDLLISFGSTADIEGMMLGKDVIVIEGFIGGMYRKDPYKKALIQIEKGDDLTSVVNKILWDKSERDKMRKKREEYIKRAFYKIDGRAHERVADLIVNLTRK